MRPIVSSIGTYNYKLAKYLSKVLNDIIPMQHCATDSFSFVQDLNSQNALNTYMVSYDVVSLFTNVPLIEVINLAIDLILDKCPNFKMSRLQLKKLFLFATSQTHFLFDGTYYDQVDGVAMGSSLGPVLENLEKKTPFVTKVRKF